MSHPQAANRRLLVNQDHNKVIDKPPDALLYNPLM
jgi:hypothetical protein